MPDLAYWQWAIAAFSAFSIGIAKTGVPGLGILAVPMFVFAVGDARLSAGWMLPVLLSADLFAVFYYRRHASAKALFSLLPWVALGMGGGAFFLSFPERVIRPTVGGIILAILLIFLLSRRGLNPLPAGTTWHSGVYGAAAGFATMVANAAGPVMNVYLMSRNLPRQEFVATGAWFFLIVNSAKIPVYLNQGLIDSRSLAFDSVLLPASIAGALVGRKVLAIMPEHVFVTSVTVLAFVSTILLFL